MDTRRKRAGTVAILEIDNNLSKLLKQSIFDSKTYRIHNRERSFHVFSASYNRPDDANKVEFNLRPSIQDKMVEHMFANTNLRTIQLDLKG